MLLDAYPAAAEVTYAGGMTSLHWALQQGASVDVIKMLLHAYPAVVTHQDIDGRTPFLTACDQGDLDSVRFLREEANVDVERAMHDGSTPFLSACSMGHMDIVTFLSTERDMGSRLISDINRKNQVLNRLSLILLQTFGFKLFVCVMYVDGTFSTFSSSTRTQI